MTLTLERVREVLLYEPDTGEFFWRVKMGNGKPAAGCTAGSKRPDGRYHLRLDGKFYMRSRLAWFYVTGRWPTPEVDHKNYIPTDDRFDNLREATRSQNHANMPLTQRHSVSGMKGARYCKRYKKFYSCIKRHGKQKFLGYFATAEEASAAYFAAAKEAFGEFARVA